MKILITGGSGKLAKEIVDNANTHEIISLSKDVFSLYATSTNSALPPNVSNSLALICK